MFEGDVSQQLLVRAENEWLAEGKNPIIAPTDLHAFHIQEHRAVLDDTDIRSNEMIIKGVMDHIQGHMDMLTNTDPRLLQLTGQQPLPPPMPPGGQPPQGGPPPGPGGPPQGSPQGPPPMHNGQAPQGGMPQAPQGNSPLGQEMAKNMPKMPQVPAHLLPNPAAQEASMNNVRNK
jgi:hypothetical protein